MGDPAKAAQRMLELVTLTAPPVRLMLGRDAYAMWDTTLAKRQQELNAWRERGKTPPLMAQNSLKFNCNAPR